MKPTVVVGAALRRIFFAAFCCLWGAALVYGFGVFANDARTAHVLPFAAAHIAGLWCVAKRLGAENRLPGEAGGMLEGNASAADGAAAGTTSSARAEKAAGRQWACAFLLTPIPALIAWLYAKELSKERAFASVVWIAAALVFGCNALFCCLYRYSPVWDADAVFQGAQNWAAGCLTAVSTPTFDADAYFYYFPNNLGATWVLSWAFRVFGAGQAYRLAAICTSALVALSVAATAYAGKELGGEKTGATALCLLCAALPIWVCGAAFYTDFASFVYPVGGLYLLLRARRAGCARGRALWTLGAGAVLALGALVKITVLIVPLAYALWSLVEGRWRQAAACALAVGALTFGAFAALNAAVYPAQLDPARAKALNTPTLHWIYMGLQGDGFYNGTDYEFTRSFADPAERDNALWQAIGERVRQRSPAALADHFLRKIGFMLNDGTMMLSDYYDDSPSAPALLQETLLPGGTLYGVWKAISGGAKLGMMALALAGALTRVKKRERDGWGAVYLALFGLMLFLAMWETSKRYGINLTPILALCAAGGLERAGLQRKQNVL